MLFCALAYSKVSACIAALLAWRPLSFVHVKVGLPLQGVLGAQYELYKEHQSGGSYKIPDGTELDVYQKVSSSQSSPTFVRT